jgi:hypothetical protein
MGTTKLSPPWAIHYQKINAMFKDDPEVTIKYDEENKVIKLLVNNNEKAEALKKILPEKKEFGNVTLEIQVEFVLKEDQSQEDIFRKAFSGNPAFSSVQSVDMFNNPITFVVFENKVVQFYSDNLMDINGYTSTLYQEIAKDIFNVPDYVYFCTESKE